MVSYSSDPKWAQPLCFFAIYNVAYGQHQAIELGVCIGIEYDTILHYIATDFSDVRNKFTILQEEKAGLMD